MSSLRDLPQLSICHKDLMLATPGKLFSAAGWIYELKYDGFRCLICKHGDTVRLESRNGLYKSPYFPELVDELRPIPHDFVADGELVVLDERGCPQWHRLQKRHVLRDPQRIPSASVEDPAAIFAFDLLSLDGADFRKRTLLERKAALHRVLPANKRVRYTRHINDSSAEVWELAIQMDLEGIMAKDAGSIYMAGRTTRWLKIKTDVGTDREKQRRPR
jgi:bifunctional non-homologous end joining protein LigD